MTEHEATASAVALKLPNFWTTQSEIWFAQAEAQFYIRGVTSDDTKYYYAVAALDQDTATRLLATLQNPPENNKYSSLKTKLLKTYGFSRRERAAKLLDIAVWVTANLLPFWRKCVPCQATIPTVCSSNNYFFVPCHTTLRCNWQRKISRTLTKLANAQMHFGTSNCKIAQALLATASRSTDYSPKKTRALRRHQLHNQSVAIIRNSGLQGPQMRLPCSYLENAVAGRQ